MVTLRRTKGAPLTHDEMDNNFAEVAGKVNSANPATSGTWTHTGAVNLNGGRPISLSPSMGEARIKGEAGAWAAQYAFSGSGGADFGGFGALGTANTLSYYYIGPSYLDNFLRLSDAGVLVHKPVPLGYGAGAGGTVGQATSKSTAVTINRPSGIITTHNAALAAGGKVTFAVNNSLVAAGTTLPSVAAINNSIGDSARYRASVTYVTNGAFYVTLENIGALTYSDNVDISFSLSKVATS